MNIARLESEQPIDNPPLLQGTIPIQKDRSQVQSLILKKLVQPFILRRVKTDKTIIKDLPDKVEHKQYWVVF